MAKHLITVIGPTAIGKTALAIKLANHFKCEIISCDSRQFYKEMTIGTAVPDSEELAAATHHFIHNKSIFETYSVGDFEKEAVAKLDELFLSSDFAVLVGGSGLYVDAVLKGFDDFPEVSESVRNEVRSEYKQSGIEYLQQTLQKLDPEYFSTVDTENPHRMLRALEICIESGKPYASFLNRKENNRNFAPIIIGLEAERPILYERINHRVDQMMAAGLLAEAERLYPDKNLNALQTVGYRELFPYIAGDFTLNFAVSEIKKNTRRFAKRQLTWFRRTENVKWFDFNSGSREIIAYIENNL